MNPAVIALALVLFTDISVLVLKSGHQMPMAGPVRVESGKAVFRHASGVLYSLPLAEIDVQATEAANSTTVASEAPAVAAEPKETKRLAVTREQKEKLLRDLEKSRGTPEPPRKLPPVESLVSDEIDVRESADEEYWRSESKRLEELVRRRREDLDLLRNRIRRLEDEIRTLVGLGVPPDQYGGNILQLEDARSMIEEAELNLARAERELSDFQERARRQGILPGWLR